MKGLLFDPEPLRTTAKSLDFCSVHVKGLVKADGYASQPRTGLTRSQFFDANDEAVQDARNLAAFVHRQMHDDLIVHADVGRAYEQKCARFAQVVDQGRTLLSVGSLQRGKCARHVAVPASSIR